MHGSFWRQSSRGTGENSKGLVGDATDSPYTRAVRNIFVFCLDYNIL